MAANSRTSCALQSALFANVFGNTATVLRSMSPNRSGWRYRRQDRLRATRRLSIGNTNVAFVHQLANFVQRYHHVILTDLPFSKPCVVGIVYVSLGWKSLAEGARTPPSGGGLSQITVLPPNAVDNILWRRETPFVPELLTRRSFLI